MDIRVGYSLQQAQELELNIHDANNTEPKINIDRSCKLSLSLEKQFVAFALNRQHCISCVSCRR